MEQVRSQLASGKQKNTWFIVSNWSAGGSQQSQTVDRSANSGQIQININFLRASTQFCWFLVQATQEANFTRSSAETQQNTASLTLLFDSLIESLSISILFSHVFFILFWITKYLVLSFCRLPIWKEVQSLVNVICHSKL